MFTTVVSSPEDKVKFRKNHDNLAGDGPAIGSQIIALCSCASSYYTLKRDLDTLGT